MVCAGCLQRMLFCAVFRSTYRDLSACKYCMCNNLPCQITDRNLTSCRDIDFFSHSLIGLRNGYETVGRIFHIIEISGRAERSKLNLLPATRSGCGRRRVRSTDFLEIIQKSCSWLIGRCNILLRKVLRRRLPGYRNWFRSEKYILFPADKNPFQTGIWQMEGQLYAPHSFDYTGVAFGLQRILWGLFKKLVISTRVAVPSAAMPQTDQQPDT